jgi:hypothetical protein
VALMELSAQTKRAMLSMRHIKAQSILILDELKFGDISKIRTAVDDYRNALSFFEEDKRILQSSIKDGYLTESLILEVKASLQISDILDKTIQDFIDTGITEVSNGSNARELNFKDFDALIDFSLPKTWNFNLDVVFLHENNRKHFEKLLRQRGQKRLIYLGKTYQKLDSQSYIVNKSTAGMALADLSFPIPIRITFLDRMFYGSSEEYEEVTTELTSQLKELAGHKNTKIRFGKTWVENCLENLNYARLSSPVDALKNIFKNQNIIIVSPGPSLEKNISALKKQSSAIVIAVAQAVPALTKHGISPDFVFVMDPQDYSHALDDADLNKICLICPDYISKSFMNKNFKKTYLLMTEVSCLSKNIFKGLKLYNLDNASSVSVGAVLLSNNLGAAKIALVGQDLSFSEQKYYGDFYDPTRIPNSSINIAPSKPQEELKYSLPGYYGGTVPTNFQYSVYHKQLQDIALNNSSDSKLFYNCTEGGASILGFESLGLTDFLFLTAGDRQDIIPLIENSQLINVSSSNCLKALNEVSRSNKKILSDIQKLNRHKKRDTYDIETFSLEQKILNSALSTQIVKEYVYQPLEKFAQSNSMGFKGDVMLFQKAQSIIEITQLCKELNLILNKSIKSISKKQI